MQPSSLTKWGAFLLSIRGVIVGIYLGNLRPHDPDFLMVATCGMVACMLLTPLLRVLGWRGLAEHTGDAPPSPSRREVERAVRVGLDAGLSLPEVVRHLHQTRGWEMMLLYPAVKKISNSTEKEAIRLVLLATDQIPEATSA